MAPVVGEIVERSSSGSFSPPAPPTTRSGFPAAQHRSKFKSAFAKSRESESAPSPRVDTVPIVQINSRNNETSRKSRHNEDWREEMSRENQAKIEAMTEEEREAERAEILKKFGPGIGDALKKARERREAEAAAKSTASVVENENQRKPGLLKPEVKPSALSSPALSDDGLPSRPATPGGTPKRDRKLRFAEVKPQDVYVYESQPPSPRTPLALIMPPDSQSTDVPVVQFQQSKRRSSSPTESGDRNVDEVPTTNQELEEGTPEDIRRRYFPTAPVENSSLEWISAPADRSAIENPSIVRFDLTGTPIPPDKQQTLPTHLGLHHHAASELAGYTLEDLLLLSRSTVPAQRATMLGVLAKLMRRVGLREHTLDEETRNKILAVSVEALAEGNVNVVGRAVELLAEGLKAELSLLSDHPVESRSGKGTISALPLPSILPIIAAHFAEPTLPPSSLHQLLTILEAFATYSTAHATTIIETPNLLRSVILSVFKDDPDAIRFVTLLSRTSRTNAQRLLECADALLRHVATPCTSTEHVRLLTETLKFYTSLAHYGLYSHMASTAWEPLSAVYAFVASTWSTNPELAESWLELIEAWIVCATNPHKTSPPHDILWSQVQGWGWAEDLLALNAALSRGPAAPDRLWVSLWRTMAAWASGARLNGVKGGEEERRAILTAVRDSWSAGVENEIITRALTALPGSLADEVSLQRLSENANTLAAACRFVSSLAVAGSQPLDFPLGNIASLWDTIAQHAIWKREYQASSLPRNNLIFRPITWLLAEALDLMQKLPQTTQADIHYLRRAFTLIPLFLPGDEGLARHIFSQCIRITNARIATSLGLREGHHAQIWEKGGMEVIAPFLFHSLHPTRIQDDEETPIAYLSPTIPTPDSIAVISTQRLPAPGDFVPLPPLPLQNDWSLAPLNELLRSGSSPVFRRLPPNWEASEIDVVRATLLFSLVVRAVLHEVINTAIAGPMSREGAILGCMKVFMLEHQQPENSGEEVFRDDIIGKLMIQVLSPYTLGATPKIGSTASLESASLPFLGPQQPFFQFYNDFLGLYDAVSFSHPTFARLLLPPTSQQYPLDYRKLLWGDFAHVLRTIRPSIQDVIAADAGEYLWPLENDGEMLSHYLKALVKGFVPERDGFLRFVAVHHVASQIWPDVEPRNIDSKEELRGRNILRALLGQGDPQLIQDIARYHQRRDGLVLPPQCYDTLSKDTALSRLEWASGWGGEGVRDRLQFLSRDC